MFRSKHLSKRAVKDPLAIQRMKKLFELEHMMVQKQRARDGQGLLPMRLLREDIERRKTAKERERGWINTYTGHPWPDSAPGVWGYVDKALVIGNEILGPERETSQTFFDSLKNSKAKKDVKLRVQERGWTNSTAPKARANECLYGLSKARLLSRQSRRHHTNARKLHVLHKQKQENATKLEVGWVHALVRQQAKDKAEVVTTPADSELQSMQPTITETIIGTQDKNNSVSTSKSEDIVNGPIRKEKNHRERSPSSSPSRVLERSGPGWGGPSYWESITAEGQKNKYNQLEEAALAHCHDPAALQMRDDGGRVPGEDGTGGAAGSAIRGEEQERWMRSYKRIQDRKVCGLARWGDKAADEILREHYQRYRETGRSTWAASAATRGAKKFIVPHCTLKVIVNEIYCEVLLCCGK